MGIPPVSEWLDMMADEVTLQALSSRDVSGKPTYSATVRTYSAYIEMKNHLVVDKSGREIMARGRVFMATTEIPALTDLLTLPAGTVPRTPPIISVNVVNDDKGNHHVTLEVG